MVTYDVEFVKRGSNKKNQLQMQTLVDLLLNIDSTEFKNVNTGISEKWSLIFRDQSKKIENIVGFQRNLNEQVISYDIAQWVELAPPIIQCYKDLGKGKTERVTIRVETKENSMHLLATVYVNADQFLYDEWLIKDEFKAITHSKCSIRELLTPGSNFMEHCVIHLVDNLRKVEAQMKIEEDHVIILKDADFLSELDFTIEQESSTKIIATHKTQTPYWKIILTNEFLERSLMVGNLFVQLSPQLGWSKVAASILCTKK